MKYAKSSNPPLLIDINMIFFNLFHDYKGDFIMNNAKYTKFLIPAYVV